MIALDPEEVFAQAIGEAIKRGFGLSGSIVLGSLFAYFSVLTADFILGFTPLATSFFSSSLGGPNIYMMPLWVISSIFAWIAIPNAFVTAFYFIRSEDPTLKRFVLHAAIQQICLTGAFNEWAFDSSALLPSLLSSALLWFFSLALLAFLFFAKIFWKNKQRCSHEEHLITVAAENDAWREKLANTEFIPPPPTGPTAPKARPLQSNPDSKEPPAPSSSER